MSTSAYARQLTVAALLASMLVVVHLAAWLLPGIFEPLEAQSVDQLFGLRTMLSRNPVYDDTVVLVPIDDYSVEVEDDFYLGRVQHARLVRALASAGVVAQFHDLIFAAPIDEQVDADLASATTEAGNVYYGLALGPNPASMSRNSGRVREDTERLIDRLRWHPRVVGSTSDMFVSTRHFATFPGLAEASDGLGFLDLVPDRDGVQRRVALLIRDGDGFLPSLPLLVISRYFGVTEDRIEVEPGRAITLRGAQRPGSDEARDIAIPIDRRGQMIVNFLGEFGTMKHYPYSTIDEAAGDRFAMEDLRQELTGKIAVVSWMTTGSGDLGAVPMDPVFPLGVVHATAMHNILTGDFLRQLSRWEMFGWVELPLLSLLILAALRLSTMPFLGLEAALLIGYPAVAVAVFIGQGLVLNVPIPLHFLIGSAVIVSAYHYHVESKARARLDRELAVAREIQLGALPSEMPDFAGYDVAGVCRPADETGGDVFDLIPLDERRMMLLLGDATGHGLGPALSVTQFRAMLRVALRLGADLDAAFTNINDQLDEDLAANRFVTAFLGVLDRDAHSVIYRSGGQGPLLHFHAASGECEWRGATSPPMGMLAGLPLGDSKHFDLAPGDILALMTDGVFEYENPSSEQFGEERVAALIRDRHTEPMARLVETLLEQVTEFAGSAPQADDVTILLLRRLP